MAESLRYCSIQEVKDRGINDEDENIQNSIFRSQDIIDRYCRQTFSNTERTLKMDGSGHDTIFLEHFPIISITSMKYRSSFYSSWTTIDVENDVQIAEDQGYLTYHRSAFPAGEQNVEIVGHFGYADVPSRIKEACILLAIAGGGSTRPLTGGNPLRDPGLQNESVEGYSWTRKTSKGGNVNAVSTGDGYVDTILNDYRRAPLMRSVGNKSGQLNSDSTLLRVVGDY
jgi:hypothetical protein